jgi:hypothetical protein
MTDEGEGKGGETRGCLAERGKEEKQPEGRRKGGITARDGWGRT